MLIWNKRNVMGPRKYDELGLEKFYEELDEACMDLDYKFKLRPISQYTFKDQCKKCLVRAACTQLCLDNNKYYDWKSYLWQRRVAITRIPRLIKRLLWDVLKFIGDGVGIFALCCCMAAMFLITAFSINLMIQVWFK